MNRCVFVQAYAKVNLTLDVLNKRTDGYHNLRSVMQSVSLYDRLRLTETEGGISIETNHPQVPCDSSNLAYKAALAFMNASGRRFGVHILLAKGIPIAAGLGGGSADAAAVLRGLNRLWTCFSIGELQEIGQQLGADVPFCLKGGTLLAEGFGERLTSVEPVPKLWMVLLKPSFGVSTGEVYAAYDRMKNSHVWATPGVLKGLNQGNFEAVIAGMGNMLEHTTVSLYPQVGEVVQSLKDIGAGKVIMCGSGPTVCAVFSDQEAAENLYNKCSDFSGRAFVVHSVSRGGFLLERHLRGEKVGTKKAFTYTTGKL